MTSANLRFQDTDVEIRKKFPNLINLKVCGRGDVNGFLENSQNLHRLSIDYLGDLAHLTALFGLSSLLELNLKCDTLSIDFIFAFVCLKSLKMLTLSQKCVRHLTEIELSSLNSVLEKIRLNILIFNANSAKGFQTVSTIRFLFVHSISHVHIHIETEEKIGSGLPRVEMMVRTEGIPEEFYSYFEVGR